MDLSGPGLDKEEKYMFWFSIVKFKEWARKGEREFIIQKSLIH
jgi:hypothetical protein